MEQKELYEDKPEIGPEQENNKIRYRLGKVNSYRTNVSLYIIWVSVV